MDNNFSMFRFNQLGGDDIDSFSSNGSNRSASPSLLFRVPPNSLVETEVSEIGVSDALHKEVREIACIGAGYVGGSVSGLFVFRLLIALSPSTGLPPPNPSPQHKHN